MNLKGWFSKYAGTILTGLGVVGVIGTAVLAAKAAPVAEKACADAQATHPEEPLTAREAVLAATPAYLPAISAGTATIACIFGVNAVNCRLRRRVSAAYLALAGLFEDYRSKVALLGGDALEHAVTDTIEKETKDLDDGMPPWDVPQTFYMEGYPEFFERTTAEVVTAEYLLNRQFVLAGIVTFNDFLRTLGLKTISEKGEHIGWEAYIGECSYGYRWIDFNHPRRVMDDGLTVREIAMPFAPHSFDEDGEDRVSVCGVE